MAFLTNDKLVIVGAAGMIGSNMVQTALMMGLTNDICLYDVFSPEGVAEEMRQSGFGDVKITATTNAEEAYTNAKYIISSGGAPRKEGMTREDLLAGNCKIAEELGQNIKKYCPLMLCPTFHPKKILSARSLSTSSWLCSQLAIFQPSSVFSLWSIFSPFL